MPLGVDGVVAPGALEVVPGFTVGCAGRLGCAYGSSGFVPGLVALFVTELLVTELFVVELLVTELFVADRFVVALLVVALLVVALLVVALLVVALLVVALLVVVLLVVALLVVEVLELLGRVVLVLFVVALLVLVVALFVVALFAPLVVALLVVALFVEPLFAVPSLIATTVDEPDASPSLTTRISLVRVITIARTIATMPTTPTIAITHGVFDDAAGALVVVFVPVGNAGVGPVCIGSTGGAPCGCVLGEPIAAPPPYAGVPPV